MSQVFVIIIQQLKGVNLREKDQIKFIKTFPDTQPYATVPPSVLMCNFNFITELTESKTRLKKTAVNNIK